MDKAGCVELTACREKILKGKSVYKEDLLGQL